MISAVITVFNKAHVIERTVKSVLDQSFKEFELIIVNDGSTDNSLEVINRFTDKRIKVIDQENQGVSKARNNGLSSAQFDYVAFLDGDDEWLPGYLSKVNEAIQKFPGYGMYCSAGVYKEAGQEIKAVRLAKKYENKILPIRYFENPHIYTHTSATTVNKKVFMECDGFKQGMGINEDFELFFSIALISKVVYIGFPLSCYYGGVEGQVTADISKKERNLKGIMNRMNSNYRLWKSTRKNTLFIVFLKYEIRHFFITYLREHNRNYINIMFSHLDKQVLENFGWVEKWMYKSSKLRLLSVFYIYLTKLRWRLRGFPRA